MLKKIISSFFWYSAVLAISLWVIGFVAFCLYALSFKYQSPERVDGIVVLTGAGERIPAASDLLGQGYADRLLISGVHASVRPEELLASFSPDVRHCVSLGYQATDTRGNAREIADWTRKNKLESILLITSFYHMPRSLFEVFKLNPSLRVIPFPIFPKSFHDSVDWIRTRYAWLLFSEYHKFIATHLQTGLERISQ